MHHFIIAIDSIITLISLWILFKQQEVGNDLSVCGLNILPKVSSLRRLLAINLVKVEMKIFQTFT